MTSMTQDGMVEFRFFRRGVRQVVIAGDFTQWHTAALSMQSDGSGWWTLTTQVPPGEHHFRYLADETWFTDFAANGVEVANGHWNSVLIVPGETEEAVNLLQLAA